MSLGHLSVTQKIKNEKAKFRGHQESALSTSECGPSTKKVSCWTHLQLCHPSLLLGLQLLHCLQVLPQRLHMPLQFGLRKGQRTEGWATTQQGQWSTKSTSGLKFKAPQQTLHFTQTP